jgi:hypothetical protein
MGVGNLILLGIVKGNVVGTDGRPGGTFLFKDVVDNNTLAALLEALDEVVEPAAGSGGFGNANDSEGEKGRTDMGVVAAASGFAWTMRYWEWSEPALPIENLISALLSSSYELMMRAGRVPSPRPISAIAGGNGGIR